MMMLTRAPRWRHPSLQPGWIDSALLDSVESEGHPSIEAFAARLTLLRAIQ
jgi:hypothetical protein